MAKGAAKGKAKSKAKSDEPKEKKVKDKDAPKKGRSAYIFFTMDRREELVAENPDLKGSVTEVSKILGAEWKKMTDKQKKPYEDQAKKDKERYEKEKEKYEKKK
mmetsp:Transcript_14783/g.35250  ORF Transcript_14783/g.35250 Transcript_14783/m.35250 type:complete len:104 (-) Transcript_14783:261-572(-)